jgi:hypothetical protein
VHVGRVRQRTGLQLYPDAIPMRGDVNTKIAIHESVKHLHAGVLGGRLTDADQLVHPDKSLRLILMRSHNEVMGLIDCHTLSGYATRGIYPKINIIALKIK